MRETFCKPFANDARSDPRVKIAIMHSLADNGELFKKNCRKHFKRYDTQAERVIRAFGGTENMGRLMRATGFDIKNDTIENWKRFSARRQKYMCNGRIPSHWFHEILITARQQGLYIKDEDTSPKLRFFPAPNVYFGIFHKPHVL